MRYIAIMIVIILVFMLIGLLKNCNCHYQRSRIINAIYYYRLSCIYSNKKSIVGFCDMEDYAKTFRRMWDWSYKNILPKEKFEIIKSYM